ncbi:MAG: molybdopterin dinucleotide binding domain-containing protein [Candidatus Jordarchaeum sp.]|uniref:molybdopterin dinucleotide binding domain-containing protein n=1 Tax=Candidatus Jordarchaeum sp. TaxID=2823881 RepID=UPI00404A20A1
MSLTGLLMGKLEVKLCNARSIEQNKMMVEEPGEKSYVESTAVILLSKEDMGSRGFKNGDNVKVTTKFGKVIVKAYETDETKKGLALMPNGPWFNSIMDPDIDVTGNNSCYVLKASIETTKEEVLNTEKLFATLLGKDADE